MRFIKILILVILFTCGLLFFIQNNKALESSITLGFSLYYGDLVWTSKPLPFFVIVLGSFAAGVLLATAYLLVERIRMSCAFFKCKSELRNKEKELARLRSDAAIIGKQAGQAETKTG
ncbi:MAG: DUF1049 domain-containing protein [Desulfovibrio sp.]|jgi:hypothetical protein|nr:DUF1049 domain-containing protein [Desulfovibrio sp.]